MRTYFYKIGYYIKSCFHLKFKTLLKVSLFTFLLVGDLLFWHVGMLNFEISKQLLLSFLSKKIIVVILQLIFFKNSSSQGLLQGWIHQSLLHKNSTILAFKFCLIKRFETFLLKKICLNLQEHIKKHASERD